MVSNRRHAERRHNLLLAALGPVAQTLRSRLQPVTLAEGQVLVRPGEPQPFVYFPTSCLACVLVQLTDGRVVEVGLIGREGVVGLPVLLETDGGPHHVICVVAGESLSMPAGSFRAAVRGTPPLRAALQRYVGVRLVELAQLRACNALHPVRSRLARWLLMAGDRIGADEFRLTQAFLARMLAVHRPYLNREARHLKRRECIAYQRGQIRLIDRSRLEAEACEDYDLLRTEYARVLGQDGGRRA